MPLPDDFSPWEHLRTQLMLSHNRRVETAFIGISRDSLDNDLSGMFIACFLLDDDTVDMILLRLMLFYWVYKGDLPQPIYGIPIEDYDRNVTYKPQVCLKFEEFSNELLTENKLRRARFQISFRLMHETSATINNAKAHSLALRIKELFGAGAGFIYEAGTTKVTYTDKINGYALILQTETEAEGERVIKHVLEIQAHAFDEHSIAYTVSKRTFPVLPGMQEVYGKEKRKPRKRPITRVHFVRAELRVWGLGKAINLVDITGKTQSLV